MKAEERIYSLDGLRGIACLVVLIFHIGIMIKPFGETPLYNIFSGTAAVMTFYVLSGVVLSLLPFKALARGEQYNWFCYFPRRIACLCIPLAVAILLGVVCGFVASAVSPETRSAQAINVSGSFSEILHDVLMQFDLLFNVSDGFYTLEGSPLTRVNSPVWSMSWELWFSIFLPFIIWVAWRTKRTSVALPIIIACIFVSHFSQYFPLRLCLMFVLGVFMAKHFSALTKRTCHPMLVFAVLLVCIGAIEWASLGFVVGAPIQAGLQALAQTCMNVGCAGLVFLASIKGFVRSALSTKFCRWLGKISYSMYLTHAIVIAALRVMLPKIGAGDALLMALVALAASFIFAWVFWRIIEAPSIQFSRKLAQTSSST